MKILKTIPILIMLCLCSNAEAQYFYINDVGTSSLSLTNVKDIKLSSSLFLSNINYLNIGYSPVKRLGLYVGLYSNKLDEDLPGSRQFIKVKGRGFNTAVGLYHFVKSSTASISQKNGREKGVLFYSKFGYSQSEIKNEFSTTGEFMEANFEYYKLYFEIGIQVITKNAKIDFNYKNAYINYLNGTFNGSVNGKFNGYFNLIRNNFSESSLFNESEFNIQGEIGRGYLSLITGIPIFIPKGADKPLIIYRKNRPLYLGINIDIDDFYHKISGK